MWRQRQHVVSSCTVAVLSSYMHQVSGIKVYRAHRSQGIKVKNEKEANESGISFTRLEIPSLLFARVVQHFWCPSGRRGTTIRINLFLFRGSPCDAD